MDDHDDNAARSWFRSKFMHCREYPQGRGWKVSKRLSRVPRKNDTNAGDPKRDDSLSPSASEKDGATVGYNS